MNIGKATGRVAKIIGTTGVFANGAGQSVTGQIAVMLKQGTVNLKNAAALLSQAAGGGHGSVRIGADAATRLQYVQLLEQALEKAERPGGNTQTQINDLSVRLRALSRESAEAQSMPMQEAQKALQQVMQKRNEVFTTMSNILQKQNETAKGVIQNIGR